MIGRLHPTTVKSDNRGAPRARLFSKRLQESEFPGPGNSMNEDYLGSPVQHAEQYLQLSGPTYIGIDPNQQRHDQGLLLFTPCVMKRDILWVSKLDIGESAAASTRDRPVF